jgi:hypothetical protein
MAWALDIVLPRKDVLAERSLADLVVWALNVTTDALDLDLVCPLALESSSGLLRQSSSSRHVGNCKLRATD